MAPICELEEMHWVISASVYQNNQAHASFTGYIAQVQSGPLASVLAKVNYFAIQADAMTGSGSMEEELFLVMYLDPHAKDGKVHICDKFLAV